MKKIFYLLLLVLGCLQVRGEIASGDGWTLSDDGTLTVEKDINYYEGTPWENYKDEIKTLIITDNVTSIGYQAFSGCRGLTSISIPNSVTSIGRSAFNYCSGLTSITIPNSVTGIGWTAFYGCSGLTSISIPNSVTVIGDKAFYGCSGLTSISIPNSVTSIGSAAFARCSGLTNIIVEEGNNKYDSRNNSNAIIETETNTLIVGCQNTIIPNSVTSIGGYAFDGCSGLTSISIPNSVTVIGDNAFSGCGNNYTFHFTGDAPTNTIISSLGTSNVMYVPKGQVSAYKEVYGTDNLYIEEDSYEVSVYVATPGTLAQEIVMAGAKLAKTTKLTVTGTLNNDDWSVIKNSMPWLIGIDLSGITNTTMPSIGRQYLTEIKLPKHLTTAPSYLLKGCSNHLRTVDMYNEINSIERYAFVDIKAKFIYHGSVPEWCKMSFNEYIGTLYNICFNGEDEPTTELTIPAGTDYIHDYAFNACGGIIKNLHYLGNITEFVSGSQGWKYGNYYYNYSTINTNDKQKQIDKLYLNGDDTPTTSIVVPDGISNIKAYTFYNCTGITSVTLPNCVAIVGSDAFNGCTALERIDFGRGIKTIGVNALRNCSMLTEITFGSQTETIDYTALTGDKLINKITCYSATPPTVTDNFTDIDASNCKLYVPRSALYDYATHPVWGQFDYEAIDDLEASIVFSIGEGGSATLDTKAVASDEIVVMTKGQNYKVGVSAKTGYEVKNMYVDGVNKTGEIKKNGFVTVTGTDKDIFVSAQFEKTEGTTVTKYTVKFVDWDGKVLKTEEVEHGKAATAPEDPTRTGYTFTGWDKTFTSVKADMTVTSQYSAAKYTVKFVDWDGKTLKTQEVEHGKAAAAPTNPTRTGYTFTGWDKTFTSVKEDITVTAQYAAAKYTVTFVDWDGTVLKTEVVEYGKAATAPENPTREGYEFMGWNFGTADGFGSVKSDMTIKAFYSEIWTPKYAQAIWCEDTKSLYFTFTETIYTAGESYRGNTISKVYMLSVDNVLPVYFKDFSWEDEEADACEKAYIEENFKDFTPDSFSGMFNGLRQLESIEGLRNINTSEATSLLNLFNNCRKLKEVDLSSFDTRNVTCMGEMFKNCRSLTTLDLSNFDTRNVTIMRGMFISCSVKTIYVGENWNTDKVQELGWYIGYKGMFEGCTNIVGKLGTTYDENQVELPYAHVDVVGNPGYLSDKDPVVAKYTVTFVDWDGKTLKTEEVEQGKAATAPADPTRTGWTFTGWDKIFASVKADMTVTAQYEKMDTKTAQVLWCEGTKTLYFTYTDKTYAAGETYKGNTVTKVYTVDEDYFDSGQGREWSECKECTHVLIDNLKSAKPITILLK